MSKKILELINQTRKQFKYILLDAFCKAGGCSEGYYQAAKEMGIEIAIIGIDIEHQPNYKYIFIQCEAKKFINKFGKLFDFIHASPPCQSYSRTKTLHNNFYPDLLPDIRKCLIKTGKPYVIENVPGAPMKESIILDGPMFDLRVIRKRKFESNMPIYPAPKGIKKGTVGGKNFTRKNPGYYYIVGGHQAGTLKEWRDAMQINWMNKKELAEAIPPHIQNI